jgi:hypothetical protein
LNADCLFVCSVCMYELVARTVERILVKFGIKSLSILSWCPVSIIAFRAASRQLLGKDVPAATDMHATLEVLLETVCSTLFVQRGYKEVN